ncbi:MAG: type II secretion system minor pseudopilin GspK, partial [Pseudomonadota bacterium]
MRRPPPRAQRGVVAILFAVLIVALCAVYSASLAWDSTLDARRSASLYWREQAVLVAVGAENWVGDILMTDLNDTETDHFGEFWALDLPPLPVDGAGITGELSGSLEDLQGRFNVNNLVDSTGRVDPEALAQFQRLLTVLEIDPRLAGIAADWIDADVEPSFPDGAEDPVYTGLAPAYRTANLPLS